MEQHKHFASQQPGYPNSAAARMPGTFIGEGAASSMLSRSKTFAPFLPCVTNQGGVGTILNGACTTLFCGRENISVLCTTPTPDRMSVSGWPGKAPQVVTPSVKPTPAQ